MDLLDPDPALAASRDPAAASFYSTAGLHVAIYDAMAAAVPGGDDIAFYRSLADETRGPILELGCGTGRVMLRLAEAGFEVVGLDLSPAMLARARDRVSALEPEVASRVRFVEGDLATTVAGHGFGLAIAAFRVFMMILDPSAQLAALKTIRGQLRPGGLVAIDLFDPRYDLVAPAETGDPIDRGTYPHPDTGKPVRVTVLDRRNDRVEQRFVEHWLFEELDSLGQPSRTEIETLTLRWTFRHEMHHLLVRAGLEPVAEYSDYAGSPPAYGQEQVWVARRPVEGP
jgi:SAM-dependent methyltransferase